MVIDKHHSGRKRALRSEVLATRAGSLAAAPMSQKLMLWHEAAARLGAKLDYLELHGQPTASLLPAVDGLEQRIQDELSHWRQSLTFADETGRVEDAERSSRGILATLTAFKSRLARHP